MNWFGRSRAGWFLFSSVVLIAVSFPARAARTELDLGGNWQFQKVSQIGLPPTNNWQAITIPGFLTGWQYEHAWFRRLFTVPETMTGTQLKLRFGGVKYNCQVWLNGKLVGGYLNGYNPFECDVTDAVLVNQPNELLVAVTDWTATFSSPVDFSNLAPYENPRDHAKNKLLAPIGGRYDNYGIWQPVKLVSVPAVFVADSFAMPSVRTQELTVRLDLRNESALSQTVTITNRVFDGTTMVLPLPGQTITLGPLTNAQVEVSVPWASPRLWSPADPYLYSLETTLTSDFGEDQIRARFGFREFRAEGANFYLNEIPIHLLATATWPPVDPQNTNQIRQVLADVKKGNNVAIRFHTQPWDEPWYEIADELGLLVVEECAVWCDPYSYRLSDARFWTNYAEHLTQAVRRDRNHPSIVLWSLENEILHCGGQQAYSGTAAQLADMGRVVKALDPTRPITYEADLDPGGVADALGLHYPHEFPDYQVWPNAAYWMDQAIPRNWVPGSQWKWDRTKPLYIGEFLWVPSTSAADFTILFGDDAYADPAYYRSLAKGLTWQMQIEAYRANGVSGMAPWTAFEDPAVSSTPFDLDPDHNYLYQVQKNAYHPNAVVAEEYYTRFFAGREGYRTLHVYNDRPVAGHFSLRWRPGEGPWKTQTFDLLPAGQWSNTVSFPVPDTNGPFNLQIELSDALGVVFTNGLAYQAFSAPALLVPAGVKAALYDPVGGTAPLLQRFGISFAIVTNLQNAPYDEFDVLIVGRGALTNQAIPEIGVGAIGDQWEAFARRGGWVFVLEQTNYPAWMPGGLRLSDYEASFAFPNTRHAAVQGLDATDLRWWANDHRLVSRALAVPASGNFEVLSGIGSRQGLEYAAALELPIESGGILCSQWLLTERFDDEPMAGILFQRLLNFCSSRPGHMSPRPVALLSDSASTASVRLNQLGLLSENFQGRLNDCDPSLYPVLIVAGSSIAWQEALVQMTNLVNYVENGGKLLLHRPNSAFLAAAQPMLFPELDSTEGDPGLILKRNDNDVAERIRNHDLYWIEQTGDWNRPELLSSNIAHRVYRKHFNLTNYSTIQVASMPIRSVGGPSGGGWLLWANGYVAQNILVSQGGTYCFNVAASGTVALGGWPRLVLQIDGHTEDLVTVSTNQLTFYSLSADLTPGTHQLSLVYNNDAYAPPEDRNLLLSQVQWGRVAENDSVKLLTRPGALARAALGKGLIVLDEIAWETESQNATKAGRYASELLSGLGAAFQVGNGFGIPAGNLTNVNVNAYSTSGGVAFLGSNGRIETPVRFTAAGTYSFQIIAGGTAAQGVLPQIGLTLDGVARTNFFLTTTNMMTYWVSLSVPAGLHKVGLAFLNDYYAPPEDRNASFSFLGIRRAAAPRIVSISTDPLRSVATIEWEGTPGRAYQVLVSSNLADGFSAAAKVTNQNTISSWRDAGGTWGGPPLGHGAETRYYRVQ